MTEHSEQNKEGGDRTHKSYSLERWLTGGAAYPAERTQLNANMLIRTPTGYVGADALLQQRDELLAAIKGLLHGPGDGFGHNSRAERQAALDAIAKAEGSAQS